MSRIISILNHKGGVGKTTTTLNLGKALSLKGYRVLIVDIDPQANLSISVNIREPKENIYHSICEDAPLPIYKVDKDFDIVPADLNLSMAELKLNSGVNGYFKFKKVLTPYFYNYDYILIDCPPSLGILTLNALIASNEVLIVVQSQFLSIEGLSTITNLLEELTENLAISWKITGLLLTQTDRTVVSKSVVEGLKQIYQDKVLNTYIRRNTAIAEASGVRQDIFNYNPKSQGAEDYDALANEIINNG